MLLNCWISALITIDKTKDEISLNFNSYIWFYVLYWIASSSVIYPVTRRWTKTEAETCRQFEIKQIKKLCCDLLKIHILSVHIHTHTHTHTHTTGMAHLKITETVNWRVYFDHYFTSSARAEHNTRAQCTSQQLGNLLIAMKKGVKEISHSALTIRQ